LDVSFVSFSVDRMCCFVGSGFVVLVCIRMVEFITNL
jgi:hypothetical protein